MSFVLIAPEFVTAAAGDLTNLGSSISAANASAASATTQVLAAGADEVSARIAALFGGFGLEYQAISAQVAAYHQRFVQALSTGAGAYASAEAAAAEQIVLGVINAPTQALLGRPLIGDGANATTPGGAGGAGGLLFGNGGAGAAGAPGQAGGPGGMRSKIPDLQRALEGRFDDHHALMCRLHLAHLDQLDAMIGALDEQIEQLMHPFCARRELIASIPGIGVGASATVISEIGADPAAWFPSAEHLASWVRLCPGNHESAGKRHHGARRTGNQHLQPVLVECAWAAVRTDGYLREYYRRQVRKFGGFRSPAANKKAIIAVAHKLIVIIWHVLATGRPYQDLGADYFTTRMDPDKERRRLVAKLEAQGLGVTLEPAA